MCIGQPALHQNSSHLWMLRGSVAGGQIVKRIVELPDDMSAGDAFEPHECIGEFWPIRRDVVDAVSVLRLTVDTTNQLSRVQRLLPLRFPRTVGRKNGHPH